MFVVDRGSESGVVYTDRNVEKFDGRVRDNAGEFKGWVEGLDRREDKMMEKKMAEKFKVKYLHRL